MLGMLAPIGRALSISPDGKALSFRDWNNAPIYLDKYQTTFVNHSEEIALSVILNS